MTDKDGMMLDRQFQAPDTQRRLLGLWTKSRTKNSLSAIPRLCGLQTVKRSGTHYMLKAEVTHGSKSWNR